MPAHDILIMKCDPGSVDELSAIFRDEHIAVESSPLRNLDGAQVNDWIVVATAVLTATPGIIRALGTFLNRNNLGVLKYGDVEIRNPRPDDVPALIAAIEQARRGG